MRKYNKTSFFNTNNNSYGNYFDLAKVPCAKSFILGLQSGSNMKKNCAVYVGDKENVTSGQLENELEELHLMIK